MGKKLEIANLLMDDQNKFNTWRYCAPIFITDMFGIQFSDKQNLFPEEIDEKSIRNGTVTFVSYKGELFALTCEHVSSALKSKQNKWKNEQIRKYGFEPPVGGYHFFTPKGNGQYHFCYEFTSVPQNSDHTQPDIAISRIDAFVMERLEREPIPLEGQMPPLPLTGIASGYPEEQRIEYNTGKVLKTFSPKFTVCVATIQITGKGELLLQDNIVHHNDVDKLSGMSGGPIIWSHNDTFGLAGIAKDASSIQPVKDGIFTENNIFILGEKITTDIFQKWLLEIPEKKQINDQSKRLHIPEGMK